MKKILLSLGMSVLGVIGFAQMSGTYTIDSGSPASATNFTSFSSAFDELTSSGVSGPVVINVSEGTYSEQIYEVNSTISGVSSTNTITIQSDPSNTNMPVVTWSSSVIFWSNCDFKYLTFDGIHFDMNGFNRTIYIYDGNMEGSGFMNCRFDGYNTTSTSTIYSIVYMLFTEFGEAGWTFMHNELNDGSYATYCDELTGSNSIFRVDSNTYNNGGPYGYYLSDFYDMKLQCVGNSADVNGNNASVYGIYAYDIPQIDIRANYVDVTTSGTWSWYTGYGIYNYYSDGGTSEEHNIIANNMVVTGGGSTVYQGITFGYGSYTDIVHNSVQLNSTSFSAECYYIYCFGSSYAYNRFENNIARAISTAPYTAYIYHTGPFEGGNNNLYWNGFGLRNYWNTGSGTSITTNLASFESASGTTGNKSFDPEFVSAIDLHTNNLQIEGQGSNVGIDDDFDGDSRILALPDIGADEFGVANNAQPIAMLSPSAPICSDDTCFQVSFVNAGTANLTSLNVVWAINGNETIENWSGNLAPGEIDTLLLTCGLNIQDGDSFSVYTALPNGQIDSIALNDTMSFITFLGLAGTYDIPGDYADFVEAAADVNLRGICASCIMDAAPGTYNGYVQLRDVDGSAEDKTVTWRSSTGNAEDVIVAHPGNFNERSVVHLINADWQIFEDLTIQNTQTSSFGYGTTILMENGSDNVTVQNNHLLSRPTTTSSTNMVNVYLNGNHMHPVIDNNYIHGGSAGIRAQAGAASNQMAEFTNNKVDDFGYYGIIASYYEGTTIADNRIVNDTTISSSFMYGILVENSPFTNTDRNYVAATENTYGISYGIYYNNSNGSGTQRQSISNNCVTVGRDGGTIYGYYGIYIRAGFLDINGNSVNRLGGSSSTAYAPIRIDDGGSITMHNNNLVNLSSSSNYTLYADSPFYILEADNNNHYSSNTGLIYNGGQTFNDLSSWTASTGFDVNGLNVDPMYADTNMCATCSEDLNGAANPMAMNVDYDVNGDMRSPSNPDIGAVEFVDANNFTLGPDSTYCADEFILEAGPAINLTWNINGTNESSPFVTLTPGATAQEYDIIISLETEHCGTTSDEATIWVVPNAHLDSNTHICVDEVATLNPGGLTTGTYAWSTGETTQTIQVDGPGVYTVSKEVMGCESEAMTLVTQSDAIEFATTEVCSDNLPLMLDATIGNGIAYAWSGGASPNTATNTFNDAGLYSVTATDVYGCTDVDTFNVNVLEAPEAAITIPTSSGNIYVFDASTTNFLTNNSSVSWDFGIGAVPATSTNVTEMVTYPWSNPANPTSYSVSLFVENICGTDETFITVTPDPLGVESVEDGSFTLFPNPANDVVTITTSEVGAGSIQVLDMSGRVVAQVPANAGSNTHQIDVNNLAAGSYSVRVTSENKVEVKPLIIQ